ncbi:MAG: hypothetical protein OYM47_17750 [Gemmatimonadota bacterium]|nr:hypothetical protein [Gemmatimonadota bacterium]
MRGFRRHLNEKLKDERFRRLYEAERQLTELSLKIRRQTTGELIPGESEA